LPGSTQRKVDRLMMRVDYRMRTHGDPLAMVVEIHLLLHRCCCCHWAGEPF
jgi:hypothetical protein